MPLMPQPISGGLRLACSNAAQNVVVLYRYKSVDYRAKQFAAQNAFCNTGDTSYPGSQCATRLRQDTSQTVADRSARPGTVTFVPLLASNSQRTWQKCLVCPLSI